MGKKSRCWQSIHCELSLDHGYEGQIALGNLMTVPSHKGQLPTSMQVNHWLCRGIFTLLRSIVGSAFGFERWPVSLDRLRLVCSEGIYGFIKLLNWLFPPLKTFLQAYKASFRIAITNSNIPQQTHAVLLYVNCLGHL